MSGTHLVFVPSQAGGPHLFLWPAGAGQRGQGMPAPDAPPRAGTSPETASRLAAAGRRATMPLVTPEHAVRPVGGIAIPVARALPILAALPADDLPRLPPSVAAWSLATKLALDLIARERVAPLIAGSEAGAEARWGLSLVLADDADRFVRLARALPLAARAVPAGDGARTDGAVEVRGAEDVLLEFLDTVADLLIRGSSRRPRPRPAAPAGSRHDEATPARAARWERTLARTLTDPGADPVFLPAGVLERGLIDELERWAGPARGSLATRGPRLCLKLDPPEGTGPFWRLGYYLQAADDPSLLLPAADVWSATGEHLDWMERSFARPQELLLRELARAGRTFPPIEESLDARSPESARLDTGTAWHFLSEAAPVLEEAGFGVMLPADIAPSGQRRLRLRMRVGEPRKAMPGSPARTALALDSVLEYRWEAALGTEPLEADEFKRLVALKRPLVRWRGQWVVLDPAEVAEMQKALEEGGGRLATREALAAALGAAPPREGAAVPVDVVAEGPLRSLMDRLREGATPLPAPTDLVGELRPYQERGLGWLGTMAMLGLGGCLADDMGLGKTVQTIAFLLARRRAAPSDGRPALIVCPMSVVGNWERELARFAPTLPVFRHHGTTRARTSEALAGGEPHAVVVTTYGTLRRDRGLLREVAWAVAILDEAQNVKNPASQQAAAARALGASHRFALTGTPVENRLAELWSILEYCVPGYLGPLETFRRRYAVPIERYRDEGAAERLRCLVRPFVLRRLKAEVAADLPPKQEMPVVVTLTREQATLYQAAVDEAMAKIEGSEGIERRGQVLALLTALKQICNHPAQYLHEKAPLAGRSGKLARVTEMLEETLAAGDRVLLFTQFREMGDRLVEHLQAVFGEEILFLHGGVPRAARDEMVRRFQEEPHAPAIFVLSLRAGGTGLNLTRATRVIHFDRWWNPAVEDQATDRAHRIGQEKLVQVYRLLAAGTIEEKIDRMLVDKRALADRVVGAGETWITELPDAELRRLVALSGDATIEEDGE